MATINIENLPDELYAQIQQLATQHNQSINEQVVILLKQALQKPQTQLIPTISPACDPTWEERCKAVPKLLADIDQRRRVNPADFGLPDSTALLL